MENSLSSGIITVSSKNAKLTFSDALYAKGCAAISAVACVNHFAPFTQPRISDNLVNTLPVGFFFPIMTASSGSDRGRGWIEFVWVPAQ